MNMTRILAVLLLLLIAPPAVADAASVRDFYVRELREDGYSEIKVTKTWLGRMRFVAEKPGSLREIVVNPGTGVVLRDYVRFIALADDELLEVGGGSKGSGSSDDDDDDDDGGDDGGDDDGDDD